MLHLQSLTLSQFLENESSDFPFTVPIVKSLQEIKFTSPKDGEIKEVKYNELEHVNLTRDFLSNPENFLRHL